MVVVDVDGSSLLVDSQANSVGLVWGLAAIWRSVCINQMNRVNSRILPRHEDSTIQHCHWYYYYYAASRYCTYVDAAYCYRRSSVVCPSVGLSRWWALQNGWTDRDTVWDVDSGGSKKHVLDGGAYWRNLVNMTEPSISSGDAAFLLNYFGHLLLLQPTFRHSHCAMWLNIPAFVISIQRFTRIYSTEAT